MFRPRFSPKSCPAALAIAALLPFTAAADEVWTTPFGEVIYEQDMGDVAILSYPAGEKMRGHAYFPGLGGNFDDRSVHWGYWIEPREGPCGATMTGPDGVSSTAWGRAVIIWDESGFPSAFTGLGGECFGEPFASIRAEPKQY